MPTDRNKRPTLDDPNAEVGVAAGTASAGHASAHQIIEIVVRPDSGGLEKRDGRGLSSGHESRTHNLEPEKLFYV